MARNAQQEDKLLRDLTAALADEYGTLNSSNEVGKPLSQWTGEDLKKLDSKRVGSFRAVLGDDRWDITDTLIPSSMSRAEFTRAIIREAARRNEAENDAYRTLGGMKPKNKMTAEREMLSIGTSETGVSRNITDEAGVFAIFDAAVQVVAYNQPKFVISSEVLQAMGKKVPSNEVVTFPLTDVDQYDLGYTIGAMPEFRPDGEGFDVSFKLDSTPEQVQAAFCPTANKLFENGAGLDPRDAFLTGLMQARIDAKTNFEPNADEIGLFAPCPSSKAGANDNEAITKRKASVER